MILLTLHLTLNYAAVRSVQMTSLNRQRANIAFSTLLESDGALVSLVPSSVQGEKEREEEEEEERRGEWKVLTPAQVAQRESIFERDGILKWYPSLPTSPAPVPVPVPEVLGYGYIGIPIHQFLTTANNAQSTLPSLSRLFTEETYLLHIFPHHNGHTTTKNNTWQATILLKQSSTPRSQLKAWMHALLVLRVLSSHSYSSSPDDGKVLQVLEQSLGFLNQEGRFDKYMVALEEHGWELDIAALETRSGRRVSMV